MGNVALHLPFQGLQGILCGRLHAEEEAITQTKGSQLYLLTWNRYAHTYIQVFDYSHTPHPPPKKIPPSYMACFWPKQPNAQHVHGSTAQHGRATQQQAIQGTSTLRKMFMVIHASRDSVGLPSQCIHQSQALQ